MIRRLAYLVIDFAIELVGRLLMAVLFCCTAIGLVVVVLPMFAFATIDDYIHTKRQYQMSLSRRRSPAALRWTLDRVRELDDSRIYGAPGWRLHRVGSWIHSRRTFTTIFEPVLSDMQVEYFDALAEGCRAKPAGFVFVAHSSF